MFLIGDGLFDQRELLNSIAYLTPKSAPWLTKFFEDMRWSYCKKSDKLNKKTIENRFHDDNDFLDELSCYLGKNRAAVI